MAENRSRLSTVVVKFVVILNSILFKIFNMMIPFHKCDNGINVMYIFNHFLDNRDHITLFQRHSK